MSLPANEVHFPKLFVSKGHVGSLQLSPGSHILASPDVCPGDSGAGCFTRRTDPASVAYSIATVVGNKQQEITVDSPLNHLTHPSRAVLVPAFITLQALQVTGHLLAPLEWNRANVRRMLSKMSFQEVTSIIEGGTARTD
jgi:hypothetical protein